MTSMAFWGAGHRSAQTPQPSQTWWSMVGRPVSSTRIAPGKGQRSTHVEHPAPSHARHAGSRRRTRALRPGFREVVRACAGSGLGVLGKRATGRFARRLTPRRGVRVLRKPPRMNSLRLRSVISRTPNSTRDTECSSIATGGSSSILSCFARGSWCTAPALLSGGESPGGSLGRRVPPAVARGARRNEIRSRSRRAR